MYRPQSSRLVERMNQTHQGDFGKWVQETGDPLDGPPWMDVLPLVLTIRMTTARFPL